jgi:hypothetical protein
VPLTDNVWSSRFLAGKCSRPEETSLLVLLAAGRDSGQASSRPELLKPGLSQAAGHLSMAEGDRILRVVAPHIEAAKEAAKPPKK